MSTAKIERVFGRGRVRMATGDHVEVFREAAAPGERRRYTKRFLATGGADFRQWTHREWRILARLIGHGVHCVPDVVQYHGDAEGGVRQLQTYDAGITVDQWATVLPVSRNGVTHRHVFEDCAHWWALAHHSLAALDEIHALHVVHLDFKADNVCIPSNPPAFDPESGDDRLCVDFAHLALIDFAFSLVSRNNLTTPLPIGWEKDYDYQSPRLLCALEAGRAGDLAPTQELDWRCDLYSLAAMLRRYLCDERAAGIEQGGWTAQRRRDARALIYRLRGCHDAEPAHERPHRQLLEMTAEHMRAQDLAQSLADGWLLVGDSYPSTAAAWMTPMTRIVAAPLSPTSLTLVHPSLPGQTSEAPGIAPAGVGTMPSAIAAATFDATFEPMDPVRSTPIVADRVTAEASDGARATVASSAAPAVIRRARPAREAATAARALPVAAAKRRSKLGKASAAALVSIAAVSAIALSIDTDESPIEALQGLLARLPQLRSSARDQPVPDEQRPAAAGIADASGEPEPATERTIVASEAQTAPERMSADAEAVVANETKSDRDGKRAEPGPSVAEGAVNSGRIQDAAPATVASRASDDPVATSATVAAEAAPVASPPQSPTARARPAATRGRPAREPAIKSPGSRSAPSTAPSMATPRGAPGTNIAQGRGRGAQSYPGSRTAANAAFPYDPVAARSATAYLTMRATRLEPLQPAAASQPETNAGQVVASLTPTFANADVRIVEPSASTATASVPGALADAPPAPAPSASSGVATERRPAASTHNDAQSGVRGFPNRDALREGLSNVLKMLGIRTQRAVPIDDRSLSSERLAVAPKAGTDASRSAAASERKAAPAPAQTRQLVAEAQPSSPPVASSTMSSAKPLDPKPDLAVQPASGAMPAMGAESRAMATARVDADLRARATRMLAEVVPRVAAQARSDASPLLTMVNVADQPSQQRRVIEAAYVPWRSELAYPPSSTDDARARHLYHEAARQAFAAGRTAAALDLELRAFAADPRDAEIAGLLAYLYLEVAPPRAETARQLALHALAFSGPRRSVRFEDWNTFAIASALAGREADATQAFLVQLTLSGDAERTCRAALRAYSTFGERLRGPVDALLHRIRNGPDPWACASGAGMLARSP